MKKPTRIVILSNKTLLAEGVITRLQQYENRAELHVVDLKQPNLLAKIMEVHPKAIILADKDPLISQTLPLDKLLRDLPNLKVIRLDAQCLQTQVICSEQYRVEEVCDLLDLIDPSNAEAAIQPGMDRLIASTAATEIRVPGADA